MLAARYTDAETIETAVVEQADPQPGEVQIEVAYTGICGTDLHIYHGHMDQRVVKPAVIGHEMSGRIAALGEGVDGWAVGAPVTVLPVLSCGECSTCLRGHGNVCPRLKFVGIDTPGSLQQRWNVPAQLLVALPESLSLQHAALVEPTAVAVHDVRRSGVREGELAVVVGGGPVGLLIATVASRVGARVLLTELDAARRAVATDLGIRAVDPRVTDVAALAHELSDGAGADVAFEVSGAAAGVTAAVDVLRPRGRVVMVAIHPEPRPVNLHAFFWRELELLGARLYERADFEEAVRLVADGGVDADAFISRVEPLSRAGDAFAALAGGGAMKVLIDCGAS